MIKWISVKEKLPDKYKRVLVTNGKQVCLHYKQSSFNESLYPMGDLKDSEGYFTDCCLMEPEEEITHWAYIDEIDMPEMFR